MAYNVIQTYASYITKSIIQTYAFKKKKLAVKNNIGLSFFHVTKKILFNFPCVVD